MELKNGARPNYRKRWQNTPCSSSPLQALEEKVRKFSTCLWDLINRKKKKRICCICTFVQIILISFTKEINKFSSIFNNFFVFLFSFLKFWRVFFKLFIWEYLNLNHICKKQQATFASFLNFLPDIKCSKNDYLSSFMVHFEMRPGMRT